MTRKADEPEATEVLVSGLSMAPRAEPIIADLKIKKKGGGTPICLTFDCFESAPKMSGEGLP